MRVCVCVSALQDISQSFLARCPEWRFNLREVTVRAMGDQGTNVDTLRTTLSQLHVNLRVVGPWYDLSGYQHRDAQQGLLSAADAAAEGAALCLAGWVSQAPMLRTYAYFTPRFRDLGLRLSMPYAVSLDPGLLFAAVQEAAHLGCLAVKEVDLPSQYVMNTWMDWPWDELHVDKLEALHMLRLPDPGHEGAPWAVCCGEMHLHKWTCEVRTCSHMLHSGSSLACSSVVTCSLCAVNSLCAVSSLCASSSLCLRRLHVSRLLCFDRLLQSSHTPVHEYIHAQSQPANGTLFCLFLRAVHGRSCVRQAL